MAKPVVSLNLDDLIDRQMQLWEVRRRLAEEGGEPAREEMVHLAEGPWLSISRQLGSGGGMLAREVAGALGWQVFDKKILAGIAEQANTRKRILSRLDEKAVSGLSDIINHLFAPESLSRGAFLREMMEVVCAIARQGRTVMVGRGVNWILDSRYGLRVRIIAPLEKRVDTLAAAEGLSRDDAMRKVRAVDDQKRAFVRQVYGKDIEDPLGYDLILNLADLDREAARGIVLAALRRKLRAD
jgi:hypothetical protein